MMNVTTLLQRRWSVVLVTVGLALLSGHWMQARVQLVPPDTPNVLPDAPLGTAALVPAPQFPDRVAETRSPRSAGCAPNMQVSNLPDSSFQVSLRAPCHMETRLRLTVAGLSADVVTDANGNWDLRLPFIEATVTVALAFDDYRLSHTVSHRDAGPSQHVILTWEGEKTFLIRAETHLSHALQKNTGGTLTQAGDGSGKSFEIHSFPVGSRAAQGVVRLFVDAVVTEANCGSTVATTAFQTGFLAGLRKTEISYTMPDCGRVGDVVRLQNLFRDMRLAAR